MSMSKSGYPKSPLVVIGEQKSAAVKEDQGYEYEGAYGSTSKEHMASHIEAGKAELEKMQEARTYDTIRTIRYDTTRYDTIRYDTIRYDTIRYDTIR